MCAESNQFNTSINVALETLEEIEEGAMDLEPRFKDFVVIDPKKKHSLTSLSKNPRLSEQNLYKTGLDAHGKGFTSEYITAMTMWDLAAGEGVSEENTQIKPHFPITVIDISIHHPDLLTSCNLLILTAKLGIVVVMIKITEDGP